MKHAVKLIEKGRNQRGAAATVLLSLFILITMAVSSLAMDIAHAVLVRTQLQNAVDSAALAGAYAAGLGLSTSSRSASAVAYATAIAAANKADNLSVSNSSPGMSVQISANAATSPTTVTVVATRTISPIFSRLVGAYSFPVSARAVATGALGLSTVSNQQVYNLAVSINCVPNSGPQARSPLNSYTGVGAQNRQFNLVLSPQGARNCGWVTDWTNCHNPSLSVGSSQVNLTSGFISYQTLNLYPGQMLIVPLVQESGSFNSKRTVIGVVGFRISSIKYPDTISGYITTPICKGTPGMPVIGSASSADNQFLQDWAPSSVQLSD